MASIFAGLRKLSPSAQDLLHHVDSPDPSKKVAAKKRSSSGVFGFVGAVPLLQAPAQPPAAAVATTASQQQQQQQQQQAPPPAAAAAVPTSGLVPRNKGGRGVKHNRKPLGFLPANLRNRRDWKTTAAANHNNNTTKAAARPSLPASPPQTKTTTIPIKRQQQQHPRQYRLRQPLRRSISSVSSNNNNKMRAAAAASSLTIPSKAPFVAGTTSDAAPSATAAVPSAITAAEATTAAAVVVQNYEAAASKAVATYVAGKDKKKKPPTTPAPQSLAFCPPPPLAPPPSNSPPSPPPRLLPQTLDDSISCSSLFTSVTVASPRLGIKPQPNQQQQQSPLLHSDTEESCSDAPDAHDKNAQVVSSALGPLEEATGCSAPRPCQGAALDVATLVVSWESQAASISPLKPGKQEVVATTSSSSDKSCSNQDNAMEEEEDFNATSGGEDGSNRFSFLASHETQTQQQHQQSSSPRLPSSKSSQLRSSAIAPVDDGDSDNDSNNGVSGCLQLSTTADTTTTTQQDDSPSLPLVDTTTALPRKNHVLNIVRGLQTIPENSRRKKDESVSNESDDDDSTNHAAAAVVHDDSDNDDVHENSSNIPRSTTSNNGDTMIHVVPSSSSFVTTTIQALLPSPPSAQQLRPSYRPPVETTTLPRNNHVQNVAGALQIIPEASSQSSKGESSNECDSYNKPAAAAAAVVHDDTGDDQVHDNSSNPGSPFSEYREPHSTENRHVVDDLNERNSECLQSMPAHQDIKQTELEEASNLASNDTPIHFTNIEKDEQTMSSEGTSKLACHASHLQMARDKPNDHDRDPLQVTPVHSNSNEELTPIAACKSNRSKKLMDLATPEQKQELNALQNELERVRSNVEEVEEQRLDLLEKSAKLECEKKELQRQLSVREQEIDTLARRCAMQASMVKESVLLESATSKLADHVENLENKLHDASLEKNEALQNLEDNKAVLQNLEASLHVCHQERDELRYKLVRVTLDRDAITERLNQCLEQIQFLQDEKVELDEACDRLLESTEQALDEQQRDFLQQTCDLRDENQSLYSKVQTLETQVEEATAHNRLSSQDFSVQVEELKSNLAFEMTLVEKEHEERTAELVTLNEAEMTQLKTQHEAAVGKLSSELVEKDKSIELLEAQLGKQANTIAETIAEYEQTLSELRSTHQSQMQQLQSNHERVQQRLDKEVQLKLDLATALEAATKQKESISAELEKTTSQQEAEDVAAEVVAKQAQEEISDLSSFHEQRLASLKQDALENIRRLTDELQVKESTISALEFDISKLTMALGKVNHEHQERMTELESTHQAQLQSLTAKQDEAMNQLELQLEEKDALAQRLEKQLLEQTEALNDLASQHGEALANTTALHDNALQQLQKQHENKTQQIQSRLEQEKTNAMSRLEAEHKDAMERLQGKHKDAIVRLEDEHERQLSMMSLEYRNHIQDMEEERALKRLSTTDVGQAADQQDQGDHDGSEMDIAQLRAELQQKQALIDSLQKQVDRQEANDALRQANSMGSSSSSEELVWTSNDNKHGQETEPDEGSKDCSAAPYDEFVAVEYETRVTRLEAKLQERDETIVSLREDIGRQMDELMTARGELEKAREDTALVEGLTADIEALETERQAQSESLCEKDTNIAELEAEILKLEIEKELLGRDGNENLDAACAQTFAARNRVQQLHEEFGRERQASEQRVREMEAAHSSSMAALEGQAKRLQNDLSVQSTAFEQDMATKEAMIQTQAQNLASYRQSLATAREEVQKAQSALAEKEVEVRQRVHQLQVQHGQAMTELEKGTERLLQDLVRSQKEEVAAKEQKIKALTVELAAARRSEEDITAFHRKDLATTRAELNKAKIALMVKEDELRDVRLIDMHELQDEIAQQKKEIHRLTQELISKEADRMSAQELEAAAGDRTRETHAMLDSLSQKNADLKRQVDRQELALEDKQQRIEQSATEIADLRIELRRFEAVDGECSRLRSSKLAVDEEREKLLVAIEREMSRSAQLQASESSLKEECIKLRKDLSSRETSMAQREQTMADLEADLKQRTNLLHDMVAFNKDLEDKVNLADSRHAELIEQHSSMQQQLAERELELDRVNAETKQLEKHHLDNITAEQTKREIAEAELQAMSEKCQSIVRDNRNIAELEKQNEALRDKIHRQEVYLKRRLEKDRALRDRSRGKSSRTPAPARPQLQAAGGVAGITRRSLGTHVESAFGDSCDLSIDWELEALLAD